MESSRVLSYLTSVCGIAEAAGQIIKHYYHTASARVSIKADNTPVTDADLAAHAHILAALLELGGGPVVSEEAADHMPPLTESSYWLVDPLDGTKEFIAGTDEFTVNIAFIEDGQPTLGVIYAPISGVLYFAARGHGSFKKLAGSQAKAISSRRFVKERFVLVASRRHSRQDIALLRQAWPGLQVQEVGSSLKFCLIAEGCADIYLRQGPTSEWDTAAAQCILEEAGGKVVAMQSDKPLVYNKTCIENPEFLASGDRSVQFNWFVK